MNKTPGQDECAARDLNPEPADQAFSLGVVVLA